MTRELYDLIKNELNSLNWADYAYNLPLLLLEMKEKYSLTDEDMLDYEGFSKCDSENEHEEGFLKGYDCPICRNRGYMNFHEVKGNKIYYYVKDCKCMKLRRMYVQLEKCGIHKNQLDKYTLDNYTLTYEWQFIIKQRAMDYIANADNSNEWFIISGQSGSGKSHICTAIYRSLIEQGHKTKYMVWKDDVSRLKINKRSNNSENQKSYAKEMSELKTVDVLYIDDFLKLSSNIPIEKDLELEIAFSIINARYANGLKTIISTEYFLWELQEMDEAIAGRMKEMCQNNWTQIARDVNKNLRFLGER